MQKPQTKSTTESSAHPQTRLSLLIRLGSDEPRKDDWEEFYDMYRGAIYGYALRMGVRAADADEIVQLVMITMLRVLPTFEYDPKRGRFLSYLMTVTVFKVKNHRSSNKRVEFLDDNAGAIEEASRALHEKEKELFRRAWQDDVLARAFERSMEQVRAEVKNPQTVEAFLLFKIERRPMKEVMQITGLTKNGVSNAVRRVKNRLKVLLPEEYEKIAQEM